MNVLQTHVKMVQTVPIWSTITTAIVQQDIVERTVPLVSEFLSINSVHFLWIDCLTVGRQKKIKGKDVEGFSKEKKLRRNLTSF